ncbi:MULTISPECIES: L-aspartate oxidase [Methylomonas]|uniref:L-aspartate oxidase n=2 Tax=Methylomonas TaxID=416 RepID=A0A126T978_9GAMM|nr:MULTISPECIES: L-aspartate oxidase [Methylomonas]AMK78643.1 L-aspartate oxidase [Methylomonas denitrificans]OAI03642.1 L-aspartate oxidase [Methylomonas methanica]TCV83605.1 L-aspartate oxidase [Methylomonas methanica]
MTTLTANQLTNTADSYYDILIAGSGGAGLSLALHLADTYKVAVLAKFALTECSTYYAQGGISAVFDDEYDSIESHIEDTLIAGAGLCDPGIVRLTVAQGRQSIEWLRRQGVNFTEERNADGAKQLHLNREGGHSHRRIVHTDDATGKAVSLSLIERAQAHPNITLLEYHNVVELITASKLGASEQRICGAYVLDSKSGSIKSIAAKVVVLATGGANKVYLYSTNPHISSGDGIALAWRAGCRISNMEFMQFHPTCLYHPTARSFLISEAVRGEGAHLILPDGERFMRRYDERMELAPRDIVARAIDSEIKKHGIECVYLDISHKSREFIQKHFPTIYMQCLELDIDISQQPIPVVPAAHYTCGGVLTDANARTDIPGLYAIGEVACTGLHGANRMASNSLLECLVFAEQANQDIRRTFAQLPAPLPLPDWDESKVSDSDEEVVISHNWDELRRFMWDYVGIVRTNKRLERAMNRLVLLKEEIAEYYGQFRITSDLLELRNLVIVAELIIRCAQQRKESRGLHYTKDYPDLDNNQPPQNTVLTPKKPGRKAH